MQYNQYRMTQSVTTFAPGMMVDLPDDAVIMGGTDGWKYDSSKPFPTIDEPRLRRKVELLLGLPENSITLRQPPPGEETKTGFMPRVTAFRFPRWFVVQHPEKTTAGHYRRRLVGEKDLVRGQYRMPDGKLHPVVAVRFVRACKRGHVGDIDWNAFVHQGRSDCHRELWIEERGTSGDLAAVFIVCGCGAERSMAQAQNREIKALGFCDGSRPWLGSYAKESCKEISRLLIRSATNAYFPQLFSVISIPRHLSPCDEAVRRLYDEQLLNVTSREQIAALLDLVPLVKRELGAFGPDAVMASIERLRGAGGEAADSRPVKPVEFEALAAVEREAGRNAADADFYATCLKRGRWESKPLTDGIERVVLIHRLREVLALVGFTRIEAAGPDTSGELDVDVQRAAIGLQTEWIPAVENRGEGIFVQIRPAAIDAWLKLPGVQKRGRELSAGFRQFEAERQEASSGNARERPFLGVSYYMLHTLSHLLLTAIALDCGYPAASLRERVYADAEARQYGILIYTGSPDAEGTLGGLVEAGRRFRELLVAALDLGRICSNDPVCSSQEPDRNAHRLLLGSACHCCLLIAETSCEQRNDFLDRSLVVPTLAARGAEFFR